MGVSKDSVYFVADITQANGRKSWRDGGNAHGIGVADLVSVPEWRDEGGFGRKTGREIPCMLNGEGRKSVVETI